MAAAADRRHREAVPGQVQVAAERSSAARSAERERDPEFDADRTIRATAMTAAIDLAWRAPISIDATSASSVTESSGRFVRKRMMLLRGYDR